MLSIAKIIFIVEQDGGRAKTRACSARNCLEFPSEKDRFRKCRHNWIVH